MKMNLFWLFLNAVRTKVFTPDSSIIWAIVFVVADPGPCNLSMVGYSMQL